MSYLFSPRLSFIGRFVSDVSTRNNVAGNYRPTGPLDDLWNVAGGAAFELLDCRVCADSGLAALDPAQGYAVTGAIDRSSAKMVDLDPDWQMSSQIWGMQLRVVDPATGELAVKGECSVTAFRDLWRRQVGDMVNGQRSGAQFVTVMTDLEWGPASDRSPSLTRLRAETQDGRLSIGMHQFGYFYTQDHPRYRTGSLVLHIGPYHTAEPETVLVHRRIGSLALNGSPRPVTALGDIDFAVLDNHAFFDIGHALPIADVDGTVAAFGAVHPSLAQLSALIVGLSPQPVAAIGTAVSTGDLRPLLTLPADPDWYRRTGGVIAAEVPAELQDAVTVQPLALFGRFAGGQILLLANETENGVFLRADDFVHRLDPGDEIGVSIHARQWGRPLAGQLVNVARVSPDPAAPGLAIDVPAPTDAQGRSTLTLTAGDPAHPRATDDLDGQIFVVAYSPKLDSDGLPDTAETGLGALDVVVAHVRDPFTVPLAPEFHTDIQLFMAQYARLYPIMSQHLFDIADYDALVQNRQAMLLAFSRDIRDPNYMPVTRDLSAGKAATLVKWLSTDTGDPDSPLRRDQVLTAAAVLAPAAQADAAAVPARREDVKTAMAETLRRAPRVAVLDLGTMEG